MTTFAWALHPLALAFRAAYWAWWAVAFAAFVEPYEPGAVSVVLALVLLDAIGTFMAHVRRLDRMTPDAPMDMDSRTYHAGMLLARLLRGPLAADDREALRTALTAIGGTVHRDRRVLATVEAVHTPVTLDPGDRPSCEGCDEYHPCMTVRAARAAFDPTPVPVHIHRGPLPDDPAHWWRGAHGPFPEPVSRYNVPDGGTRRLWARVIA